MLLKLIQALLQVRQDVLRILQAHGKTDQAGTDIIPTNSIDEMR